MKKIIIGIILLILITISGIYFYKVKYYKILIFQDKVKVHNDSIFRRDIYSQMFYIDEKNNIRKSTPECLLMNFSSRISRQNGLNKLLYNKKDNSFNFGDILENLDNSDFCIYRFNRNNYDSKLSLTKQSRFKHSVLNSGSLVQILGNNRILSSSGIIYDLNDDSRKVLNIITPEITHYSFDADGALLLNESYYFWGFLGTNGFNIYRYKDNKLSAISPTNMYPIFPKNEFYCHLPIKNSFDYSQLAYFSFFSSEFNKIGKKYQIFLCTYSIKDKKLTNEVPVYQALDPIDGSSPPIIEWQNNGNLLISCYIETLNNSKPAVYIINTTDGKIIDKIENIKKVKSLRWSPDDKKLGILALEPTKNTAEPASTKGVLYIYDLDTRKLTKLIDCPDCFDFHFVE